MKDSLSATLVSLASACLNVPPGRISAREPLSRYGMDSLGAVELAAAIERTLGCRVSESLLIECADLESLERHLAREIKGGVVSPVSAFDQMQNDSRLPPEIRPAAEAEYAAEPPAILLTGATGFLGGYLLRELLHRTRAKICCLARSRAGFNAAERIRRAMQDYGSRIPEAESRIEVVEGDVGLPRLGLTGARYAELCRQIGAVYHAAALLNWVYPYGALRDVNVAGTLELLRLACASRPKPFHFVSTVAVCYSTTGPRRVGETDDVSPYMRGNHLGYARSKWVAEALVCQAGQRGLPVTIYRPSLIAGDRASGISNQQDLLSRLIKGVILMGAAPDLDWSVDCCPVDYVAEAIAALAGSGATPRLFHLINPAPRHWRECVLWMNLFGYRVQLLPYREWLQRLATEALAPRHPLRELLPFFTRTPRGEGGLTLPELYEDSRRSAAQAEHTLEALRPFAPGSPRIEARLLERYFLTYIDRGFLPPPPARRGCAALAGAPPDTMFFTAIMRRFHGDDTLEVLDATPVHNGSAHSILAEITSWKHGTRAGLQQYRLAVVHPGKTPETKAVVVKRKAKDAQVLDVAEQVAGQCSPALGRAFARFGRDTELAGCHLREIGIYLQGDDRFRMHAPVVFGTQADERLGEWTLVLEDISGLDLMNSADDPAGWQGDSIEAAIRGLAALHSVWYGREEALRAQPWLGTVTSAARRAEMGELWTALADHAAGPFKAYIGGSANVLQQRLLADVARRWRRLEQMPRTLIHNDFNPRNVALRRTPDGPRLCAYDWELATLGVPQHDLAEFLCFVLTPETDRAEVGHYLDMHLAALARTSGLPIRSAEWELGFRLSLHDLLTDRFAMYAMIDRFRPQRYLPRVVATWRALYELFPIEEDDLP